MLKIIHYAILIPIVFSLKFRLPCTFPGAFQCGLGYCVSQTALCDGTDDCPTALDEAGCVRGCMRQLFACGDGTCLLPDMRCDGYPNCRTGKDEEHCDPIRSEINRNRLLNYVERFGEREGGRSAQDDPGSGDAEMESLEGSQEVSQEFSSGSQVPDGQQLVQASIPEKFNSTVTSKVGINDTSSAGMEINDKVTFPAIPMLGDTSPTISYTLNPETESRHNLNLSTGLLNQKQINYSIISSPVVLEKQAATVVATLAAEASERRLSSSLRESLQNITSLLDKRRESQRESLLNGLGLNKFHKMTCPDDYEFVSKLCIFVKIYPPTDWFQANAICDSHGGRLLEIHSLNFFQNLIRQLKMDRHDVYSHWVGASNRYDNLQWRWNDYTLVSLKQLWVRVLVNDKYVLRPTRGLPGRCAFMDGSNFSYLNDADCSDLKGFICALELPDEYF